MCHLVALLSQPQKTKKTTAVRNVGIPRDSISVPTGSKAYSVPGTTPGFTYPSHLTCAQGGSRE